MLKDGAQFIAFNIILMFFGFFIPVSNNDILYVSIGKYPTLYHANDFNHIAQLYTQV